MKTNVINTTLALANAAGLVSAVVREIAGNDISSSLNGNKITSGVVETLVLQRLAKNATKTR